MSDGVSFPWMWALNVLSRNPKIGLPRWRQVAMVDQIRSHQRLPINPLVPWVTFTDPEIAHIGMSEREARKAYDEKVRVLKFGFEPSKQGRR